MSDEVKHLPGRAAVTDHADWAEDDYQRARDCMFQILGKSFDWPLQEKDRAAFDNAFQHAVGILSLTARRLPDEPQPTPERSSGHGCKRAGGFVDSGCNALCDCHITLALSRPQRSSR